MRKHGVDLEDNAIGDGSRTKRLDRKDLDALMGGDGQGGIFTWREKNRRKVRNIRVLTRSSYLSNSAVGLFRVGKDLGSGYLLLTKL
jgi:protein-serine/threonine kinase